jgi:CheY-like chemotaxis protein
MRHALQQAQPAEILLVEDNPPDVKLVEEGLRHVTVPYHLSVLSDGAAALAFLGRQAPYLLAPRPDLLLLDIHLPQQSGWDVLAWVRAQPTLAGVPVVMLTGIFSPYDEEQSARLQPTRCLVKPSEVGELLRLGHALAGIMKPQSWRDFCGEPLRTGASDTPWL